MDVPVGAGAGDGGGDEAHSGVGVGAEEVGGAEVGVAVGVVGVDGGEVDDGFGAGVGEGGTDLEGGVEAVEAAAEFGETEVTELGETLLVAIRPLVNWAMDNREEVSVARSAFDRELGESRSVSGSV